VFHLSWEAAGLGKNFTKNLAKKPSAGVMRTKQKSSFCVGKQSVALLILRLYNINKRKHFAALVRLG